MRIRDKLLAAGLALTLGTGCPPPTNEEVAKVVYGKVTPGRTYEIEIEGNKIQAVSKYYDLGIVGVDLFLGTDTRIEVDNHGGVSVYNKGKYLEDWGVRDEATTLVRKAFAEIERINGEEKRKLTKQALEDIKPE